MARSRTLKIGFFKNETLCEHSEATRLLFAGLMLMADREGRLQDRPRYIKAELFPYQDVDTDSMLSDLARSGFVVRYEVEGSKYVWIPNFLKHQRPHPHEPKSEIPPCPETAIRCRGDVMTCHDDGKPNCAYSLTVLQSHSPTVSQSKKQQAAPVEYHQRFLLWWAKYPRKVGKKEAQKSWMKAGAQLTGNRGMTKAEAAEFLLEAATAFGASKLGKDPQFCPHPTTWLNQGRYDDDRTEWNRVSSESPSGRDYSVAQLGDET